MTNRITVIVEQSYKFNRSHWTVLQAGELYIKLYLNKKVIIKTNNKGH